jgi:ketosteroid isomerase-like protein
MKKVTFILALLLATSASFGQSKGEMPFTTSSPEAYKLLRQALVAYGDVNLDEGTRLTKEAVAKDPEFAMAYLLMYAPNEEEERQNLAKAEALKLSADEKMVLSGVKARRDNKPTTEFFGPVLAKYPKDDYLHMLALLNSDQPTRVSIGEGLVKRNPKFAPGHNLLGYAYMEQNEMAKAEASFNKYVSLRPDLANVYDSKGDYMARAGNFKEAVTLYEKAAAMGMANSARKARVAKIRLRNPDLSDKDVQDIKMVTSSSMDEYKKGNVDGYMRFVDNQAIEIFGSQISNIGAPNIQRRVSDLFQGGSFTKLDAMIKDVKGLGPLALAWGRIEWTFKSKTSDQPTDYNRNVVFMLRRQPDGAWKTIGWVNDMANQTESADDVSAIRKVLVKWNTFLKPGEAMQEQNIDVFASTYSSQAVEILPNGRSNVGIGNLRARWSGFLGGKSENNSLGPIGIEVSGHKAVAWGAAIQDFSDSGSTTVNKSNFPWIMVLTKEKDDQWRILTLHWLNE